MERQPTLDELIEHFDERLDTLEDRLETVTRAKIAFLKDSDDGVDYTELRAYEKQQEALVGELGDAERTRFFYEWARDKGEARREYFGLK